MSNDNDRRVIASCECGSLDHVVRFSYFAATTSDPASDLYLTFHLKTWAGFWKRLWRGVTYAFGRTSRYGEWDECILSQEEEARKVRDLLIEYIDGPSERETIAAANEGRLE